MTDQVTAISNVYFDQWLPRFESWSEHKIVIATLFEHSPCALSLTTYQEITGLCRKSVIDGRRLAIKHGFINPRPAEQSIVISETVRWTVFERDGFACKACGSHLRLTIDHIIPQSLGGSDDASNLETLCRGCNSRKGNKQ
jgi:hypothetical protein